MSLRIYLTGLVLATLLAWACLVAIFKYFEPINNGLFLLILFYLSLFIGTSGFFTLMGIFLRRLSRRSQSAISQIAVSFRQGMLLALILIAALFLQSQGMLKWWSILALVIIVGFVEWLAAKK